MRKIKIALLTFAGITTLGLVAVGCGRGPDLELSDSQSPGAAGETPSGGDTTIPAGLLPNFDWDFKVTGQGRAVPMSGGALKVTTDTTLKVRITAGHGLPLQGTGWTIGFNCEKFRVTVGTVTKTAFVKKTSYATVPNDPCAGAATSWAADFSNALSPGHGDVAIRIDGAIYDNCRLAGGYGPYYGGCPLTSVHSTHSIDGKLEAFTD